MVDGRNERSGDEARRYVHGLVKVERAGRRGWCAPMEVAADSPRWVSFAIPEGDGADERYVCEISRPAKCGRDVVAVPLCRSGGDAFVLAVENVQLSFTMRSASRSERGLPYVGALRHADFERPLIEIEPDDPAKLDELFRETGIVILGCDAHSHYSGATP